MMLRIGLWQREAVTQTPNMKTLKRDQKSALSVTRALPEWGPLAVRSAWFPSKISWEPSGPKTAPAQMLNKLIPKH